MDKDQEVPPSDPNEAAKSVLDSVIASGEGDNNEAKPEKNPAAVALGRLGGLKGGKARAKKLSPERRSEIARKAAQARYKKKLTLESEE